AVARTADEAHHLRRLLHEMPAFVVDAHGLAVARALDLHQHVAREELALALALLPAAHLDHFLGRHQHLAELLLHLGACDPVDQGTAHLVLEARIGVHDVPALGHWTLLIHWTSAGGRGSPSRAAGR